MSIVDPLKSESGQRSESGGAEISAAMADATTQSVADDVYLFPLSFGQERLWFLDQIMPSTPLFNLNQAHRISIALAPDFLRQSLSEVVRRHEMLRTTFRVVDGEPKQVVAKEMRVSLPVVDLTEHPARVREEEALRLATEEARQPFDLSRGPLLRTKLLQLQADDWIFLMTMHHIISDGWSMVVFWRELRTIWSAYTSRRASTLPELSIQYGDFAAWQRSWLKGSVLQRQVGYWRKQLEGVRVLELPSDRVRPDNPTNAGELYHFSLPASIVSGLLTVSQRAGATLFMTLLAAFQVLLYRYTGEIDITVGTYIAGRNRTELEQLIGFFLNTLAMRLNLSGNPPFLDLLARAKEMTLDSYAHQDVPFAKLVEELRPQRDLSRNPFFQTIFQMLNLPPVAKSAPSIEAPQVHVQRGTAIFDLTCTLWESGSLLKGHIEYNTALFDRITIERFVGHYTTLLAGIASEPQKTISALPILSFAERQKALHAWNDTRRDSPESRSLMELLEFQASCSPASTALIDGEQRISFGDLNLRANQIARLLRKQGAGPETVVAVLLKRSAEAVVAMLAVMKTGAAFLLLDPNYPEDRVCYILNDAGAKVVLTRSELTSKIRDYTGDLFLLDKRAPEIEREAGENLGLRVEPDLLAYVIYTSGSTGKPKGVAVEYAQIWNRLSWMWRVYPFAPGETCCQKTPLHFVDYLWEILGPVLKGVPIVIVPDEALRDPAGLIRILARYSVSRIWVVPSLLRTLLEIAPDLQRMVPALRFWVTTGEALNTDLLKLFNRQMPDSVLYNLYGTSEVWDATWYETGGHDENAARVPIGAPIDNVRCYVLDARLELAPAGVTGELYVGGRGVARCYLNQSALTAARFIPDPFSTEPGARLYNTGDLAMWRRDGTIVFVGRLDHQIKIRGFRLEPREVESLIEQHPDVAQAVVVPEYAGGESRLHAYFVACGGRTPAATELRSFLRKRGQEHLIPHSFQAMDSFPLLPNGKLDRHALTTEGWKPVPDQVESRVPAQTQIEETIASAWRAVLDIDEVGIDDNFFDLGGHSLSIIKVHQRLVGELAAQISVIDLFRYPTIRSLATVLEPARSMGGQGR